MTKGLFSNRPLGLGILIAALMAVPAQAMAATATTSVDTSGCSNGQFVQPFLSWNDSNSYELMPGETAGSFNAAGWTLTGGAKIIRTTLADGTTGQVLDLPSGSKAVSPTICVQSNYPTARTIVRDVKGSEGVFMYISYEGTSTWSNPQNTGQVHSNKGTAWDASDPFNLQPDNAPGWKVLKLTLVPGGKTSDFQIYDLYVDPRMSH